MLAQLVIAEVINKHIDDAILNINNKIDQTKIQHIARLGNDWYCKVNSTNLFEVPKPNVQFGIELDAIPNSIKVSSILTGNDLGMLANVTQLPTINPY